MPITTFDKSNENREIIDQNSSVNSLWAEWMEGMGEYFIRYGLVLVLLWIGAMKFTTYEAEGIAEFVSNSPLMAWVYQIFSIKQFSALLGVTELLIAVLIAARPLSARISALGSILAAGMFVTTLSFLLTTPGVSVSSLGFPALSVVPGQFLLKDFVLLGAALWTAGEALRTARRQALLQRGALRGYDPVAYFTLNEPTLGTIELASEHRGEMYYFTSPDHKTMFDEEPEKYVPQYGGYCAYGVALGQLFDVDPKTGQVIDGRLYVNLNPTILAEFNKDPAGYIEKADSQWPRLQAESIHSSSTGEKQ